MAAISISGSGPGIFASKLSPVFEPSYTTKEDRMGMGLSIERTIVEMHTVENQSGGGSMFRIQLPLARSGSG
jgi:signal transduction histidine kinase